MNHFLDGDLDELGRIEGDRIVDTGGKACLQLVHPVLDQLHCVERIRARLEIDRDRNGGRTVQVTINQIAFRAKLDTGHVLQTKRRGILAR